MNSQNTQKSLNILLAFDGSQHASSAIELLRDLPLTADSKILILGVLIPRDSSNHAYLEASLAEAEKLLSSSGFQARQEMVLGYPAEIIMQYASQENPDLIILGAKGLRHTLGILLGGVAQQIIEYAEQPVMIVRAPYTNLKHVLLMTDGSPSSQKAIEYIAGTIDQTGEQKCRQFPLPQGITLHVLHVLPPATTPELLARSWPIGPDVLPPFPLDQEAEALRMKDEENVGRALLDATTQHLGNCISIKVVSTLKRGDAATEILDYIKEHHIDLAVAGSRGLSQMRAWLLGSVSRKVVHYASCSVLIVK